MLVASKWKASEITKLTLWTPHGENLPSPREASLVGAAAAAAAAVEERAAAVTEEEKMPSIAGLFCWTAGKLHAFIIP